MHALHAVPGIFGHKHIPCVKSPPLLYMHASEVQPCSSHPAWVLPRCMSGKSHAWGLIERLRNLVVIIESVAQIERSIQRMSSQDCLDKSRSD